MWNRNESIVGKKVSLDSMETPILWVSLVILILLQFAELCNFNLIR